MREQSNEIPLPDTASLSLQHFEEVAPFITHWHCRLTSTTTACIALSQTIVEMHQLYNFSELNFLNKTKCWRKSACQAASVEETDRRCFRSRSFFRCVEFLQHFAICSRLQHLQFPVSPTSVLELMHLSELQPVVHSV